MAISSSRDRAFKSVLTAPLSSAYFSLKQQQNSRQAITILLSRRSELLMSARGQIDPSFKHLFLKAIRYARLINNREKAFVF
nr:hypothetical protein DOP62_09365 [Synechococcus elongatus PCC 11801]